MKLNKVFSAFVLMAAMLSFAACEKAPIDDPVGPKPGGDTTDTPSIVTDATVATVAEVIALIDQMEDGAESQEYYEVAGVVTNVSTSASDMLSYKNLNFTLTDETGSIASWYTNYLENKPFSSADQMLNVGDTVVVIAHLKKYVKNSKTTPELVNGYLKSLVRNQYVAQIIDKTFAEVVEIGKGQTANALTPDYYRFKGVVSKVSTSKNNLVNYGNCDFNIADPTGASKENVICYHTNWLDNQAFTNAEDIPTLGDTVVVVGPLTLYGTSAELVKGYIESIVRAEAAPVVPDDETGLNVPEGTISCARAIEIGKSLNENDSTAEIYYIKGIVVENSTNASSITKYGSMTFYMVDNVEDTERFEAYSVWNVDSTKFVDLQQIVPGNVVVVKSCIKRYVKAENNVDQIETSGYNTAFVYSSTNTFVPPVVVPVDLPEGTQQEIDFVSNVLSLTGDTDLKEETTYTVGEITMTVDPTPNKSSGVKITTSEYRMYKNTTLKLQVPAGKNIKYISLTTAGSDKGADLLTCDSGEISVDAQKVTGIWTGSANTVTFSNTGQVRIYKLLVIYN